MVEYRHYALAGMIILGVIVTLGCAVILLTDILRESGMADYPRGIIVGLACAYFPRWLLRTLPGAK